MKFTLPHRARPSKATSRDETRPALHNGYVVDHDGGRVLLTTDSVIAAVHPVAPDTPATPVSVEALRRIERGDAHESADDGTLTFTPGPGETVTFSPPAKQAFPAVDTFDRIDFRPGEGDQVVSIALDPWLLVRLAKALGGFKGDLTGVRLDVKVEGGTTRSVIRVARLVGKPDAEGEPFGLLMPVACEPERMHPAARRALLTDDVYLVRLRSGDKVHRSTCRYATGPGADRWHWADANPLEDWLTTAPWLKPCQFCLPPSPFKGSA